jgi:hypothetical protein
MLIVDAAKSDLVRDLLREFRSAGPFELARDMHEGLAAVARRLGWSVFSRMPAPTFPKDHGVRRLAHMDLVAARFGVVVACEFDRRSPRAKSIAKLVGYSEATHRVVVLREGGHAPYLFDTHGGPWITVVSTRIAAQRGGT